MIHNAFVFQLLQVILYKTCILGRVYIDWHYKHGHRKDFCKRGWPLTTPFRLLWL